MATVDVTVRGAGIFGLSVAYACLLRGARVRVVDPGGPGAGASGGIVGALAPHVPEAWNPKKAFQLDALLGAGAFWAGVEEVSDQPTGYGRTGRIQPLTEERDVALARQREETARMLWTGAAEWRVVGADAGDAWSPLSQTGLLVHDTLTARLHPRRAVTSLAAALGAMGAEIVTEAPDEGVTVWATGWTGLGDLSGALGRTVGTGLKGQAVLLDHAAPPDAPQIFAGGLHIVPHDDGTVAVGSTSERDFDDPATTGPEADALYRAACEVLPVLRDAPILERWAGVRPRARTRAPMLGPWPDRPGHFVANGGFKIGFGIAPGVARVMADLVLEGKDSIPEGFRVTDNL